MQNDIHSISGRIKNIIAREDIALSPVGKVLVNYFTLMLKELYDFSETLSLEQKSSLNTILDKSESIPKTIIQVANPAPEPQFFDVRYWDVYQDKEFTQTVELSDIIENPYGMKMSDIGLIALNQLRRQKGLPALTEGCVEEREGGSENESV